MKIIRSGEELAKALNDNNWTVSKSTDKTIAIMAGMAALPWDIVKLFNVKWATVGGEIVPIIQIIMKDGNYKDLTLDELGLDEEIKEVEKEI